jgi:hypothetical protein
VNTPEEEEKEDDDANSDASIAPDGPSVFSSSPSITAATIPSDNVDFITYELIADGPNVHSTIIEEKREVLVVADSSFSAARSVFNVVKDSESE